MEIIFRCMHYLWNKKGGRYITFETPLILSYSLETEVPTVLESREETRQRDWPHYRLPFSLQHLDKTEPCSLSQLCLVNDIVKRRGDCMTQEIIKSSAHGSSPCPPYALAVAVSLCVSVCHCHSDQRQLLQSWKGRADGWFKYRHINLSFCGYFWEKIPVLFSLLVLWCTKQS